MKPLTDKEIKLFAAKYSCGPFSYYNITQKCNLTVAYYRGEEPLIIQNPAAQVLQRFLLKEVGKYVINAIPKLTYDQVNILADSIREMLRG